MAEVEQPPAAAEQPFKRGDIVLHRRYGLAVVHGVTFAGLLDVNWIVTSIEASQNDIIYRHNHEDFDMRTGDNNFTKIGEVPDADI